MPHSNICMWTDYITNWESGGGEKFHLANDASVCPTCPTTPAHATRCPREREYEKRSRQRDCPLSGAFPDESGSTWERAGWAGREGGPRPVLLPPRSCPPLLTSLPTCPPACPSSVSQTHIYIQQQQRALLVQQEKLPLVLVLIISKQAVSQTRSSTTNRAHWISPDSKYGSLRARLSWQTWESV